MSKSYQRDPDTDEWGRPFDDDAEIEVDEDDNLIEEPGADWPTGWTETRPPARVGREEEEDGRSRVP